MRAGLLLHEQCQALLDWCALLRHSISLVTRRTAKSEALAIEVAAKEEAATTKKELEAARARQRAILA